MGDERGRARGGRGAARPRRRTGAPRRRGPRLTRFGSPTRVVAATTELLGLSSTRRAAVLAAVVCVMALTVSVPLRNFVVQRQELAAVSAQQQALAAEVERLEQERQRLSDPAEVAAQARSRLGYVAPGEVPYVVQLPEPVAGTDQADPHDGVPWYERLWSEVARSEIGQVAGVGTGSGGHQ